MKNILIWFFLCFFGQHFYVIACLDNPDCEHKKYGHRRALLKHPLISMPLEGTQNNYMDYFKQQASIAQRLRRHLIETGAFTTEDENTTLLRQIAREVLATDPQELSMATIETVITFPEIAQALAKRNIVMNQAYRHKIRKKALEIKEKVESKDCNIASFGFVFFDQEGKPINKFPFHFSPNATLETLEEPFFFLSGRRHRSTDSRDPYQWTALPEHAPKNIDLVLMPPTASSKKSSQTIEKAFQEVIPQYHWLNVERLRQVYQLAFENYGASFNEALLIKAGNEPFFNYVYERTLGQSARVIKSEVCTSLLKSLNLPALHLNSSTFYPKEKAEGGDENEEKDFTHSEQYALFLASSTFEKFLDVCIQRIMQEIVPQEVEVDLSGVVEIAATPKPLPRTVESYGILIYSSNVMCVRCAQSVVIDFAHTAPRGLSEMLNGKLDTLPNAQPIIRPMVFMAGYTNVYNSELYNAPCDSFEHWIRQEATGMNADLTLKDNDGYETCSPEESPEMIYHVQIPHD